ncbi:hypothetical protein GWL_27950 [Herbaspirillum sp. GW103]|nr:hypothetical protein GWL_27950 [Herbaspirillum sp. GW103]
MAGINPHGALRCSNRWSSCGGSMCGCVPLPLALPPGKPPIIRAASGLRRAPVGQSAGSSVPRHGHPDMGIRFSCRPGRRRY